MALQRKVSFINIAQCSQLWDDDEERAFREWLRQQRAGQDADADFSEFDAEQAYRNHLKDTAANAGPVANWGDSAERMYRQKYIQQRSVPTFNCASKTLQRK